MSADGQEQREAERLESAHADDARLDLAEQLADESRDNPPLTESEFTTAGRVEERHSAFADSLFEFAKATNDVYRTAYEAGRAAAWTEMLVRATAIKVTK